MVGVFVCWYEKCLKRCISRPGVWPVCLTHRCLPQVAQTRNSMDTDPSAAAPGDEEQCALGMSLLHVAYAQAKAQSALTGWAATGVGAVFGLCLANLEKIAPLLCIAWLRYGLYCYAAGVAVHVFQRALFIWTQSAVEGMKSYNEAMCGKASSSQPPIKSQMVGLMDWISPQLGWVQRHLANFPRRRIEKHGFYASRSVSPFTRY